MNRKRQRVIQDEKDILEVILEEIRDLKAATPSPAK